MFSIGKIAKASGCKVQTIRYYEQIGLIDKPMRSEGNQRFYQQSDVEKLQFIRHARSLGFSTDTIKALLQLDNHQDMSCEEVDSIAKNQLQLIKQRIEQLQSLADELSSMLNQCSGGNIAHCRIMQSLHEHTHCEEHRSLTLD